MKKLGEILIERGVLALSELHTGLEACRRSGGRLGTQLLKFGFVDEPALLRALAEQYGVRAVAAAVLKRAPIEVLSLVPPALARRLRAVPFERLPIHLKVAMINPRDPVALEEIAELTGLEVLPFVATETAVLEAIARLDAEPQEQVADVAATDAGGDWDRLWQPPRARPQQLLELRRPPRTERQPASRDIATFPGLASVPAETAFEADHPIDEATFRGQLASAVHRDEVARLTLRYAAGFFNRVCLFVVHRGSVLGWAGRGHGVVVDDLQSYTVPLDEKSLFHDFRSGTRYHLGPIPDDRANQSLLGVLGDPKPLSALLLPIRVREHAAAFLLADNPNEQVVVPVEHLVSVLAAVGLAIEVLILRKKITG
jgi:nitroreductase